MLNQLVTPLCLILIHILVLGSRINTKINTSILEILSFHVVNETFELIVKDVLVQDVTINWFIFVQDRYKSDNFFDEFYGIHFKSVIPGSFYSLNRSIV